MVEAAMKMKLGSAAIGLFLLVLTGVLIIPRVSHAEEVTLTREVLLEKGMIPKPTVIVRTNDNGFVIAGGLTKLHQGWATRTDAEGNVRWRYLASPAEKSNNAYPKYNAAVIMPDDSVFLCGDNARLTHLDKDGKVLSEQSLSSTIDGKPSGGPLLSCAAWRDGLALVGSTADITRVQSTKDHPLPFDGKYFYWVLATDQNGKVKWEKRIPVPTDFMGTADFISPIQTMADGGFAFAATRYGTELVHMAPDGNVQARKHLKDVMLTVAKPTDGDTELRLISRDTTSDAKSSPITFLALDDNLNETNRIAELHQPGFIRQAYRLPDQSLVLFGSLWTPSFARVTWLDPTLKHEQVLDLSKEPNTSFWVDAAVPLEEPGEFACVREVMTWIKKGEMIPANTSFDLALDFVALKPSN